MKILKKESPEITFSSAHLSDFYFPGRGFIASLALHVTVFAGSIFIPLLWLYLFPPPSPERVVFIELNETTTAMYLPPLQSSKQTAPSPEGEEADENRSPAPPPAFEGLTYPGPQPILSNPPNPTNESQTILQPEVENPKILEPPQPVPNILQTEGRPPVVQKPSEPVLKMDLVPLERMDFSERALISPDLPAEAPNPGMQIPEARIPDLIKTAAEPEMVLPESELIPPERMNPSDQDLASAASPVVNPAPNTDFSASQLPSLIKTAPGSEMNLPDSPLIPIQRMDISKRPVAPTNSSASNPRPKTPLPATQIPGQIRSAAEPEMNLPDSPLIPIQRMDTSKRPVAPTNSPVSGPNQKTGLSDTQIPGQIRSAAEPEMPLPDSPLIPIQRMDTSKRAIAPEDELLAVTPIPAVPRLDVVVPEGELHGFFRISPQPNLDTSKTEAGSKQKDIPEENIAAVVNPVDGESEVETGSGTGKDPFVVVTNTGAGSKSNEDSSSGPGENALEGITIVEGGYEPRDGLNIKGAGPEDDSSTNISITGGAWEPGDGPDPVKVTPTPRPLQTFYDLYIISTDKSGGVLPDDFGLFRNTQIYTGFLDMRQSEDEQDPPWTVAFGLPEAVETESILTVDEEHKQEGFLPPFPKEKKQPNFPEELVRRHLGEEIIVYGYLDTEGRFKDLFIISQYESLLEARLRDALNTWEFRPARLYDKPVEVKIVMSIPLWLPEDVSK